MSKLTMDTHSKCQDCPVMLKHDSGKQEKTDDRVLCSVDRHRPVANNMNSSLTEVKDRIVGKKV